MTYSPPESLKPRKSPRQARSKATIDAILEATIQVLLADGARRLNTTRVAERAGVSVGTLYQYFPHKQALLYAVVQRYMNAVVEAVEACAEAYHGQPIGEATDALATTYIDAKAARPEAALALYRVSGEMDMESLANSAFSRMKAAAVRLLSSSPDAGFDNVEEAAFTVLSTVTGATRVLFENEATPEVVRDFRTQICLMCRAYLNSVKRGREK